MLESCPRIPQKMVASTFRVSQSQISRIQNNREKLKNSWKVGKNLERKRNRKGKGGLIELKLLEWYNEVKKEGLPISGMSLMEKARNIGEELNFKFTPTTGWLGRWKNRNGIILKLAKNQEGLNCLDKIINHWRRYTFTKVVKDNMKNVWFLGPLQMLSSALPSDLDSSQIESSRAGKVAMLFLFNAVGAKRKPPLIVGTEPEPADGSHFNYFSQLDGVITKDLFIKWLMKWDKELRVEGEKISLFLCKAPYVDESLNLHFITLHYFPQETDSKFRLHPFYLCISNTFKSLYRYEIASRHYSHLVIKESQIATENVFQKFNNTLSISALSLLDRLIMIQRAWKHIHPDVFVQGMVKAGLSKDVKSLTIESDIHPPYGMTLDQFKRFINIEDFITVNLEPENTVTSHMQLSNIEEIEALLACNILRNYLQSKHINLIDHLAKIESCIQKDTFTTKYGNSCVQNAFDPFFSPSSIHSLENHKNSVVSQDFVLSSHNDRLSIPTSDDQSINTTTISSGIQESVGTLPRIMNEAFKLNCQITPLATICESSSVEQYQTSDNYVSQNMASKAISVVDPRTVTDINTENYALHSDLQHPRPLNDMSSQILSATSISNQAPTFITFASHF